MLPRCYTSHMKAPDSNIESSSISISLNCQQNALGATCLLSQQPPSNPRTSGHPRFTFHNCVYVYVGLSTNHWHSNHYMSPGPQAAPSNFHPATRAGLAFCLPGQAATPHNGTACRGPVERGGPTTNIHTSWVTMTIVIPEKP